MAVKIITPKPYTGEAFGVTFVDGEGVTDNPSAINYARRHGYQVLPLGRPYTDPHSVTPQGDAGATDDTSPGEQAHPMAQFTVPELREYAREHQIDLTGRRTKADILVTVLAHQAQQVAGDPGNGAQ